MKSNKSLQTPVGDKAGFTTIRDYITTVTILESISDAIFILNTEGKIEYANKSALGLLQIDLEKLIGKFIDEIVIDGIGSGKHLLSGKSLPFGRNQELIDKLSNGVFGGLEASLVNNGYIIPVFLNFSMIFDEKKKVRYIIVTAKDISHRKALEEELKHQQALSISRDRVRALGELSVGLVHELSQSLGALKLKMDMTRSLLKKPDLSKESITEKFTDMLEIVNRLAYTVENIRLFAGQMEDDILSLVNINETIANACRLVSYEFDKRKIKLRIRKEKRIPYVVGNALSIEQVMVNLLTNARDAFDELEESDNYPENIVKEIKIKTKATQGKWVEISVEDNAGGMDEKIEDKIFEPFFTTKEPGLNSGVGLSIAKSIITSMGGDISVKVRQGKGACFLVRIPVHQKDERTQLFNLIEMLNQH